MAHGGGHDKHDYMNQVIVDSHGGEDLFGGSYNPNATEEELGGFSSDEEDNTAEGHDYMNQEAVTLNDINGCQPWMHGDVDRNEASKRLLKVKRIGQYLVRMKGSSGRVFVFSFLFALDKEPSHTLIQFGDERQIHIDGKPIAAACSSLTDAVSLLCQITSDKFGIDKLQIGGIPCSLIRAIELNRHIWDHPLMDRGTAEEVLKGRRPGAFIVRKSSRPNSSALSVRISKIRPADPVVHNAMILESTKGYELQGSGLIAFSKAELVRQMLMDRQSVKKSGIPKKLRLGT